VVPSRPPGSLERGDFLFEAHQIGSEPDRRRTVMTIPSQTAEATMVSDVGEIEAPTARDRAVVRAGSRPAVAASARPRLLALLLS
jgi:hypothetical protein